MNVFVTGASGWIGSATTAELVSAGHRVTGLARSQVSADRLRELGAEAVPGDLDDLDAIRAGAKQADAVIHLANKHDWSNMAGSNSAERAAVDTIGDTLLGTDRPFLMASGLGLVLGRPITEEDASPHVGPEAMRGGSEALAMDYAERGVHSAALRFAPTVHGPGDHGFIALIARAAREHGAAAYVGDGENHWPAVHRLDAARLVRLALEQAPAGAIVHAVAEEGVRTRDIAEAIGVSLDLPTASITAEESAARLGFVGQFFALDITASSVATRALLGWEPTHPTLVEDIADGAYGRS